MKERLFTTAFASFADEYAKSGSVKYVAHWVWWEGNNLKTQLIGKQEEGLGLQKNPAKHPDQAFWEKKKKLAPRPNDEAAIVTDCKLLPCMKDFSGCAFVVPKLIEKHFGSGIPVGIFCHFDFYKSHHGKMGYYTESGASAEEVLEAMETGLFVWDWDMDGDGETY